MISDPDTSPFTDTFLDQLSDVLTDRILERMTVRNRVDYDPYLNVVDAAAYVGCSVHRIYALVSQGKLVPDGRDGQRLKWKMSSLDAYLTEGNGH